MTVQPTIVLLTHLQFKPSLSDTKALIHSATYSPFFCTQGHGVAGAQAEFKPRTSRQLIAGPHGETGNHPRLEGQLRTSAKGEPTQTQEEQVNATQGASSLL